MARAASLQRGATLPDTVIKAQVFIKTIFMLFHVDQHCLYRSVCTLTRNKHNPNCATTSSSSSEDFHQHKVQILATESSCHEQDSDYVLPYCFEVLQLLLFFQ